MRFQDIPKFTPDGSYQVDIPLAFLERNLASYDEAYGLHLNPDFQRGNVWSEEQQIKWLEFFFRGGKAQTSYTSIVLIFLHINRNFVIYKECTV